MPAPRRILLQPLVIGHHQIPVPAERKLFFDNIVKTVLSSEVVDEQSAPGG
ncbi:hypothetical protein I553_5092 [Mycobacterium xenopi 4042]|uniref:Uncharacterized protein n=1 Tax=Mycobacterium xenopi 4042 TaxID=1299334 RepID=X7ZW28_MYCXE|nr:hypothetical protein I553_5092 [Mycobacterium xenopi 4042]